MKQKMKVLVEKSEGNFTMADSDVGSFSDSDVNQRSGTFCVMDVQTILFNAYKT